MAGVIYFGPGNGGTSAEDPLNSTIINVPTLKPVDIDGIVKFSKENNIGLVVVDSEVLLVNGVADELEKASIPCFGPKSKRRKA